VAFPYDKVSRNIGQLTEPGKYLFTPAVELFTFTRKFIPNKIELQCLSADGLYINLDVTQQYQLNKNELKEVLFTFGDQITLGDYIDVIAQDTIRDVCALFNAEEFFTKRGEVEQGIISNLTFTVDNANAYVTSGFVQLTNIALPNELLNSIQDKQLALEDVDVAENERNQVLIEIDTELREAEFDAEIKRVDAEAGANAIIVSANQFAESRSVEWTERANAFSIDINALNINGANYVNEYLYPRLIAKELTREQQACLQTCPTNVSCWYCFSCATPSILV
jgi:hypothetical protein